MAASQIEQLRSSVRGRNCPTGDATYESARKVYNGMIDKRPALVVQCVDVADVIAAVNYARTNKMLTAIRGGGHNGWRGWARVTMGSSSPCTRTRPAARTSIS